MIARPEETRSDLESREFMRRDSEPKRAPLRAYGTWLFGMLTLCALVIVVLRIGELARFVELARGARPAWLLVALAIEVATYAVAAGVWQRTLVAAGEPVPLYSLVPLGVAKIFTDQALPSAGLSGMVLLAHGLERRGIRSRLATSILIVSLISFYSSYLIAMLVSIGVLWMRNEAHPMLVSAAGIFSIVAIAVPAAVLWLRRWARGAQPTWPGKVPGLSLLLETVAETPEDLLRNGPMFVQTSLIHLSVFVLDALTFWVIFKMLGAPIGFMTAFIAFVMASVVATISLIPLGLGTFEASAVTILSVLGVGVEVALAATLLLRGLTFWLPMLPGVWLAHREMRGGGSSGARSKDSTEPHVAKGEEV
jgi:uncharacterized membrane protein YbhN (UPF0104 family)